MAGGETLFIYTMNDDITFYCSNYYVQGFVFFFPAELHQTQIYTEIVPPGDGTTGISTVL